MNNPRKIAEEKSKLINKLGFKQYLVLRMKATEIHEFYVEQDIHVDIQVNTDFDIDYEAWIDIETEEAIIELIKILMEE